MYLGKNHFECRFPPYKHIYVCRGKRDMNGERLIDFENKNPDVQI
jgi:hypothetical protein